MPAIAVAPTSTAEGSTGTNAATESPHSTLLGGSPAREPALPLFGASGKLDSVAEALAAIPPASDDAPSASPTATPSITVATEETGPRDTEFDEPPPPSPDEVLAEYMHSQKYAAASPSVGSASSIDATIDAALEEESVAEAADDVAAVRSSPVRDMLSTITSSKRNLAIVGAGAGVLAIVLMLAFCGGGSKKSTQVARSQTAEAKTAPPAEPATPPTVEPAGSGSAEATGSAPSEPAVEPNGLATEPETAPDPKAEPPQAATEPAEPAPDPAPAPRPAREPKRVATSTPPAATTKKTTERKPKPTQIAAATGAKGPMLGGKPVVLEYDTQARDNKPSPGAPAGEQKAISKARVSYAAGNQKLFAGDATSAILYYKQSLAAYPGYVAGYRGFVLAYAKLGDKPKAAQALKTYQGAAPGAKDIGVLKKRVDSMK